MANTRRLAATKFPLKHFTSESNAATRITSTIHRALPGYAQSWFGFVVAGFGLLVALAMVLMKVIPAIPGHFTGYEWLALGVWILLGATARRRNRAEQIEDTQQLRKGMR